MVAVFIMLVAFVAVNDPMLPEPLAARPIEGPLFVQLLVVPATELLKLTAVVAVLLHTLWLPTAATSGVGLTVIVNICAAPEQLFADGVTLIVATLIALVVLVAVNAAILPEPDAARPIEASLFVQL